MSQERSPWPTITFLGVLCGLALGAIVIMMWRGSRRELDIGGGGQLGLDGLDDLDLLPPPTTGNRLGLPRGKSLAPVRVKPVARSLTISSVEPTPILKAVGRRDWKVFVRVIGPPGSSASFMISNSPSDAITLEGGDFHDMRIPHGEFLYAQGNMPGVQVSASGGET